MNITELHRLVSTAAQAAHSAGHVLESYFQRLDSSLIESKSTAVDLVTAADKDAEQIIRNELARQYPEIAFIGEESGPADSIGQDGYCWIVDPLDGTSNFVCGLPIWSVSIALCQLTPTGYNPLTGVVYAPQLNKIWTAVHGLGAWLNAAPIQVRSAPPGGGLENAMIATGFPYTVTASGDSTNLDNFTAMQSQFHKIRRLGSAAIDLAFVADGTYDGIWELGLKIWDIAAGQLLISEAGGLFKRIQLNHSDPEVHIIATATPELMDTMQATLVFPS